MLTERVWLYNPGYERSICLDFLETTHSHSGFDSSDASHHDWLLRVFYNHSTSSIPLELPCLAYKHTQLSATAWHNDSYLFRTSSKPNGDRFKLLWFLPVAIKAVFTLQILSLPQLFVKSNSCTFFYSEINYSFQLRNTAFLYDNVYFVAVSVTFPCHALAIDHTTW